MQKVQTKTVAAWSGVARHRSAINRNAVRHKWYLVVAHHIQTKKRGSYDVLEML
ncbi:hypothetical protein GCM10023189_31470 [Nibrella saemangeumensis]|uniref:Transposase n=1 Tax=Nibrella saemangeumensis TaxID=1084526 RepID=A0ABP8N2G8_9BACT